MYEWVVKGKIRNKKNILKSYMYFKTVYKNKMNKRK